MNNYILACLIVLTALTCLGCSDSNPFPVAKVEGIVMCDGQPVPDVLVQFDPVRTGSSALVGKRSQAVTNGDGQFVLTTYNRNDGAIVGKHEVRVAATQTTAKDCPAALSLYDTVTEVEVEKGKKNIFTIDVPVRDRRVRLAIPDGD